MALLRSLLVAGFLLSGVQAFLAIQTSQRHNGADRALGSPRHPQVVVVHGVKTFVRRILRRKPRNSRTADFDVQLLQSTHSANLSDYGGRLVASHAAAETPVYMGSQSFSEEPVAHQYQSARPSATSAASSSPVISDSSIATTSDTLVMDPPVVTDAATAVTRTEPTQQELLEEPLYALTPVNRTLTVLEQEFRDMLENFSNYSQRDIMSLRDERVRVLFEGVAASAYEPAVYRAFEVLFEDLYPLRVAARVIYKKLRHLMEDSKVQRQQDVDTVVAQTGLDPVQVEATWLLFVSTASKINRGAYLTKDQLVATGFMDDVREILHPQPVESLIQRFDEAKRGRITFTDFIIGLHGCAAQECSVERQCDSLMVLEDIVKSLGKMAAMSLDDKDLKKIQFGRRYDEMLDAFKEWQDLVPKGKGRRMDVVRGCFIGAENEQVVRALRICYVDYAGLRMAAEIIFKLVKTLMAGRQKALQNQRAASSPAAR